jgi:hypothetical protein
MNCPAENSRVSQKAEFVNASDGGESDTQPCGDDPSRLYRKPFSNYFILYVQFEYRPLGRYFFKKQRILTALNHAQMIVF